MAILVGVFAGLWNLPMRPRPTLRVLTTIAIVGAGTAFTLVAMLVAGFAARYEILQFAVRWCPVVPIHHEIGLLEGLVATLLMGAMLYRIRGVLSRRRSAVAGTEGQRFRVLDTDQPIAYAAPSSPGCVVVSTGLLRELSPKERQVLFAHERAHLHQRHDRHLLVGALATAIMPPLAPLVSRLRLATERCADEAAVEAMGGDRELVATSVARAALVTTEYADSVASFGGGSIPFRVSALIDQSLAHDRATMALVFTVFTAVAGTVASSIQLHHLVELVGHVCGR